MEDRTTGFGNVGSEQSIGPLSSRDEGSESDTSHNSPSAKLLSELDEIWEKCEGIVLGRIEAMEAAVFALMGGAVSKELRLKAAA